MTQALPPGTKRTPFTFKVYKADTVKRRLEELFHGKCAYCESYYASQAPVDVEHFRPKGAVEGEAAHPGYWWLAMAWTNLLPSCLDCNRRRKQMAPAKVSSLQLLFEATQSGKKDSFPIAGTRAMDEGSALGLEDPLLLDPSHDEPEKHLTFSFANGAAAGLILPKASPAAAAPGLAAIGPVSDVAAKAARAGLSVRGAVSIQIYGLNRMRLVQERARLVQKLRFLEMLVISLGDVAQTLATAGLGSEPAAAKAISNLRLLQGSILSEMRRFADPEAPYSALAQAYLVDFKQRLAALPVP